VAICEKSAAYVVRPIGVRSGINIMDHGFPTVLYCPECGFPQMRVLPDAESAGAVRYAVSRGAPLQERCAHGEPNQLTVAATRLCLVVIHRSRGRKSTFSISTSIIMTIKFYNFIEGTIDCALVRVIF
jgi:hypothetical protein